MSRIAKKPIFVPNNVNILLTGKTITIKNNAKILQYSFHDSVLIEYKKDTLFFKPKQDKYYHWMQAGTVRALINSMIIGVTVGFERKIQLVGVGYRISMEKNHTIVMLLGYSHPIRYILPSEVTGEVLSPTEIILKSINKQLLGQVAADLRKKRKPECYKGKGVRYFNEKVRIKEAKKK